MRYPQPGMTQSTVRLHRWDEIALEKVTEMISRKIVTGDRAMVSQIYLKRGALVPMHAHESEQVSYVLQGGLKFLVGGEEVTVRDDRLADDRVPLHLGPLGRRQRAGLLEDVVGDVDLADVVQDRRVPQRLRLRPRQSHLGRQ